MSKVPVEATIEREDKRKKKEKIPDGQMQIGWYPPYFPPENGDGNYPPNYPPEKPPEVPHREGLLVEKKEICLLIQAEHMEERTPDFTNLFCCPEPPLEAEESNEVKKKKKQLENLNGIQSRE